MVKHHRLRGSGEIDLRTAMVRECDNKDEDKDVGGDRPTG